MEGKKSVPVVDPVALAARAYPHLFPAHRAEAFEAVCPRRQAIAYERVKGPPGRSLVRCGNRGRRVAKKAVPAG